LEIGNTLACVRTARGTAAIGSIEVCGPDALHLIQQIFRPSGENPSFEEGQLVHGRFFEADQVLDEGLVGVEGPGWFALHCHGNPLILQQILTVLQKHGVQVITLEEMLTRRYIADSANAIEAEAKLQSLKAVSLLGVQIIQNQMTGGLLKTVQQWIDTGDVQTIRRQAEEILQRSQVGRRIIHGVRIVIAGPPNSGKSTLLNRLAGQEQALVSDIPGTTRDWVTACGRIEPLRIEWIDTAGLDDRLAGADSLDQTAQHRSRDLLAECDLILYVLDGTQTLPNQPAWLSSDVPVITLLNKSDLPGFHRTDVRPDLVSISAKDGAGMEDLARAILHALQVDTFDPLLPVTFTARQQNLLRQIAASPDRHAIKSLARQLFWGPKSV
jgi:tRNA modification GTPase